MDNDLVVGLDKAEHPIVSPGPGLDDRNPEAARVFATTLYLKGR